MPYRIIWTRFSAKNDNRGRVKNKKGLENISAVC